VEPVDEGVGADESALGERPFGLEPHAARATMTAAETNIVVERRIGGF